VLSDSYAKQGQELNTINRKGHGLEKWWKKEKMKQNSEI